jgi:hypothetical protein
MGVVVGPRGISNGLLFCIDAANPKSHSPIGSTHFNPDVGNVIQHPIITNLGTSILGQSSAVSTPFINQNVRIHGSTTGLFQGKAVSYPSGNYGSEEGLMTYAQNGNGWSGARVTNTSPARAWNYHLWDYETNNWRHLASTADFNGRYSSGMGYDTYAYSGDPDTWVTDYDNIKNNYPHDRFLHVVYGTHAHTYQNTDFNNRLYDLGAPSNYNATGTAGSWKEVWLIGKPGLGAGNAYAFTYENGNEDLSSYATTNAHVEFSVNASRHDPNNYWQFDDNENSYIHLGLQQIVGASAGTVSFWGRQGGGAVSYDSIFTCETGAGWNDLRCWLSAYDANSFRFTVANGSSSTANSLNTYGSTTVNTDYHIVGTYDGTNINLYVNGALVDTLASSIVPGTFTPTTCKVGQHYSGRSWNGRLYKLASYDKAWTADEVLQEFNAHRNRLGI